MKGMRGRFQSKSGRPKQRPKGRTVRLLAGLNGSLNNVWRFR